MNPTSMPLRQPSAGTGTIETNRCTGPRYPGEHFSLSSIEGWHGKFGHLNVTTLDHDSYCTGKGKHDRVSAFFPQFCEEANAIAVYCRIDHLWNLGMPTEAQIQKVINNDGISGSWKIKATIPYTSNHSRHTDVYATKILKGPKNE